MNLDEIKKKLSGLNLEKYELIKKEDVLDINSEGMLLKHKKSGARVLILANDDENKVFSIGFKTPPYNDTGLQHIIEHTVLCGSRKYPVKDPFVELCKGSLNTFLNAMTYPDKTVYPVASCNDADFKNIMDVYMDAVFYPAIYDKEEIFKQEGWHYELDKEDGELKYNGVVYNEMKGVYSSADDILTRHTFVSLFPDTTYRFESGGEPECIPQLTREEYLDYHRKIYHPVNSYIYLYGDMDVQERLDYLDEEYLSDFDKNDVNIDTTIQMQKPFDSIADETHEYAITQDEPLDNNAYISYNKVVGSTLDEKLCLAMKVIDYVLVMAPGACLKQKLIDRGIGTDIYSSFETSVLQPVYSIVSKNADENKKQEFLDTIEEVLKEIVKNGFDKRMALAGINYYEFKYREADYGSFPKGLINYLSIMDSWIYDENEPFVNVNEVKVFNELRQELENGYYEKIINDYLINNNHGSVITLIPKQGLDKEKSKKEAQKLEDYKKTLSAKQIQEIIRDTESLKKYQDEPSSQKELETIPQLKLSDISENVSALYIDKKNINETDVIHHNLFTNNIAYINCSFNCKSVPDELIPYAALLSSVLGLMDTENYSYAELTNEININCGGILTDCVIYTDNKKKSDYMIRYEVRGKTLYEKIPFVLEMFNEIMFRTQFGDYKRLKEIIAKARSRMESNMASSGNTVAAIYALAQLSESNYFYNQIKGYGFYELIYKLDTEFETLKEDIVQNFEKLVKLIFTKENLIISITADDNGYKTAVEPLDKFIKLLDDSKVEKYIRKYEKNNVKTGFASSSQVQYVARCGNFEQAGLKYNGALKVLKIIFSYDYLWINVRVKGGAYGCSSGFTKNGDAYLSSYRDPNIVETNEIFEKAVDYVENFDVSERDMVKFIIGTIGGMDMPMNPSAKGTRSFSAYLSNVTLDDFKKERMQVLEATPKTIRDLAPIIKAMLDQNYLCVVGNTDKINENSSIFDEIRPLILA